MIDDPLLRDRSPFSYRPVTDEERRLILEYVPEKPRFRPRDQHQSIIDLDEAGMIVPPVTKEEYEAQYKLQCEPGTSSMYDAPPIHPAPPAVPTASSPNPSSSADHVIGIQSYSAADEVNEENDSEGVQEQQWQQLNKPGKRARLSDANKEKLSELFKTEEKPVKSAKRLDKTCKSTAKPDQRSKSKSPKSRKSS